MGYTEIHLLLAEEIVSYICGDCPLCDTLGLRTAELRATFTISLSSRDRMTPDLAGGAT